MVCLGNICRSPMADGWLRHKTKERNLKIVVESAGTANYHVGSPPDKRMIQYANDFGVDISNLRARQFVKSDFDEFDVIFAMDQSNKATILRLARNEADRKKVKLYLNELFPNEDAEVADPYYGEASNFIEVIELLDKATTAFLDNLKKTTN